MPVSWSTIYLVESLFICLGNALSIFVFWRRRHSLRRTSYLLINLAVADLSLGVFMAVRSSIATQLCLSMAIVKTLEAINALSMFASIFSLTLVSLETAYAIVFPFRHRTADGRAYCFAVTLVWILAALFSLLNSLPPCSSTNYGIDRNCSYDNDQYRSCEYEQYFLTVMWTTVVLLGMCLILLSASYLLIWWFVSKRPTRQMRERDQRKKLSVTLFIVTVLSLMTYIPGQLSILGASDKRFQFAKNTTNLLFSIVLSNSLFNPLVYTFRMPEFRTEIKLIICKLKCFKLKLGAAAPSSPACHMIPMSIVQPAHEIQVIRSPCAQLKGRNDNNVNQLQFQSESLRYGFENEGGLQESACTVNK